MESGSKRGISTEQAELLRQIPSVDELLAQPRLKTLAGRVDRGLLVEVIRTALADLRSRIAGDRNVTVLALESGSLEEHIANEVERILAQCRAAGCTFEEIEVRKADLEDVFVQVMNGPEVIEGLA